MNKHTFGTCQYFLVAFPRKRIHPIVETFAVECGLCWKNLCIFILPPCPVIVMTMRISIKLLAETVFEAPTAHSCVGESETRASGIAMARVFQFAPWNVEHATILAVDSFLARLRTLDTDAAWPNPFVLEIEILCPMARQRLQLLLFPPRASARQFLQTLLL